MQERQARGRWRGWRGGRHLNSPSWHGKESRAAQMPGSQRPGSPPSPPPPNAAVGRRLRAATAAAAPPRRHPGQRSPARRGEVALAKLARSATLPVRWRGRPPPRRRRPGAGRSGQRRQRVCCWLVLLAPTRGAVRCVEDGALGEVAGVGGGLGTSPWEDALTRNCASRKARGVRRARWRGVQEGKQRRGGGQGGRGCGGSSRGRAIRGCRAQRTPKADVAPRAPPIPCARHPPPQPQAGACAPAGKASLCFPMSFGLEVRPRVGKGEACSPEVEPIDVGPAAARGETPAEPEPRPRQHRRDGRPRLARARASLKGPPAGGAGDAEAGKASAAERVASPLPLLRELAAPGKLVRRSEQLLSCSIRDGTGAFG